MLKFLIVLSINLFTSAYKLIECVNNQSRKVIDYMSIEPEEFSAGEEVQFRLRINNTNVTLNDGFIHYTLSHAGRELYPQVDDLCASINCPLRQGPNDVNIKAKMPEYEESINFKLQILDRNLTTYMCLELEMEMSWWQRFKNFIAPTDNPIKNVPLRINLRRRYLDDNTTEAST